LAALRDPDVEHPLAGHNVPEVVAKERARGHYFTGVVAAGILVPRCKIKGGKLVIWRPDFANLPPLILSS
jgi:hypothetical protein